VARRSILLLVEFFVDNKASKDGVSSKTENGHENSSNDVGKNENDDGWDDGRVEAITECGPVGDDKEGSKSGEGSNEDFAEEYEDASDTRNNTHSQRISEDKEESSLS